MDEKLFTTEQVANILQVHPFTILKFIKQGKLRGIKLGRVYRIKESDVEKFLEERVTQPKSKKEIKVEVRDFNPDANEIIEVEKEAVSEGERTYEVGKEKGKEKKDKDDHYFII